MRTRITITALLLCLLPAAARADPLLIAGGYIVGTGPFVGSQSVQVTGPNFSFSGYTQNTPFVPSDIPGGTTLPLSARQLFFERNTLCFSGTCFVQDSSDPDAHDIVAGNFTLNAGTYTFPQFGPAPPSALTFTVPFTITGTLNGFKPGGGQSASLLVIGQGEVTFTYGTIVLNGQTYYEFRRLEGTFADATPEPAAILLLATGLAGVAARARRRLKG